MQQLPSAAAEVPDHHMHISPPVVAEGLTVTGADATAAEKLEAVQQRVQQLQLEERAAKQQQEDRAATPSFTNSEPTPQERADTLLFDTELEEERAAKQQAEQEAAHKQQRVQQQRQCDGCGGRFSKLQRCGRCKQRHYCSKKCQRSDWKKGHKAECPTLVGN